MLAPVFSPAVCPWRLGPRGVPTLCGEEGQWLASRAWGRWEAERADTVR